MAEPVVTPLVKRTLNDVTYRRDDKIERLLAELEQLPRLELVARCAIRQRSDPGYVPSECLLYFVRACRADNSDTHFERLYKILATRILQALPRGESTEGVNLHLSLTKSRIRERAFDRFVGLLADDRHAYSEKLDFYEVKFDGAVANLRRDAQGRAWREENRTVPLEYDPETNEPSAEVERAVGAVDPFSSIDFDRTDYRSRLDAAIDALPEEQSRIIEMLRKGFPIDSKDPNVMTIAKALARSEKTIRTYRDRAVASLRAALSSGDDQ